MLARLARKARLYGGELAFAIGAPATFGGSLDLIRQTVGFHLRNARRAAPDHAGRLTIDLRFADIAARLTLRPGAGDLAILYEVLARGSYRIDARDLAPDAVETIVDAGANVGITALYFASRYRKARIIAIEPNPENFALLAANTAGEPRIVPIMAALTGTPVESVIVRTSGPAWGYTTSATGPGVRVPALTPAELMQRHAIARVDLFKIDIEGGEREVFANGAFLDRVGTIIAELHGAYGLAEFNRDLVASGHQAAVSRYGQDPMLVLATHRGASCTAP